MRQRVPVYLIDYEQREHDQRDRIIPETLAQQPDDDPQFDRTVAQQIERDEMLRADRQVPRPVDEMGGDGIMRVRCKLGAGNRADEIGDYMQRDNIDPDRRDDLADREKRLQQQRDLEEAVNSLLAALETAVFTPVRSATTAARKPCPRRRRPGGSDSRR